jgi:hypothetical protein
MEGDRANGFLARWARRKDLARSGVALPPEPAPAVPPDVATSVAAPVATPLAAEVETPAPVLPTLQDVAGLTGESDFSRFVAPGVGSDVRNAAMKKLFTDPHFNVMDGLDTYIDDYGKPDPIPLAMLRQMNQSKFLRLFDDEEKEDASRESSADAEQHAQPIPAAEPEPTADDHPDLQLQQDHAAGRPGPDQGAGA